ncbi:hypothetical protein Tco_0187156 [Tanacetum coccineum]
MKPFGCPVTILNTTDHVGKFDGKANEDFFVRYSLNSKAFKVFNNRTRIVEENLHIRFSESTPNVVGCGPEWLFDIDALIRTINYELIVAGTQSNGFTGTKASDNAISQKFKPIYPFQLEKGQSIHELPNTNEGSNQSNQGVTYPHSSSPHTSAMVKAQEVWVFVLKHSQKKHNVIQNGMTCWQSSGVHNLIKRPQLKCSND